MSELKLKWGETCLVDQADLTELSKYNWYRSNKYAVRSYQIFVAMHRQLMGFPKGLDVDHIDGDGLNNQRKNLRICTRNENQKNQRVQARKKSSKYKGVSFHKPSKRFQSYIKNNGKYYFLGYYKDENKAALAYNDKAQKLFGAFACLNEVSL